jgi:hypothetical protein
MKLHFASAPLFAAGILLIAGCGKSDSSVASTESPSAPAPAVSRPDYPALTEEALLVAFQRGARDIPDFVRIAGVKFEALENNPPNYLIKGRLTYEIVADTFRPVRTVGVERYSVTLVEPVRRAGESFEVEYSQRALYSSATSVISPPKLADWKALGQPKHQIPRPVEIGSAEATEAQRQAEIYKASREELDRIGSRAVYAERFLADVSEEGLRNAANGWLDGVKSNISAMGHNDLVNAIDGHVFNDAAFSKLSVDQKRREIVANFLANEIVPEAKRLVERAKELKTSIRAATEHFSR